MYVLGCTWPDTPGTSQAPVPLPDSPCSWLVGVQVQELMMGISHVCYLLLHHWLQQCHHFLACLGRALALDAQQNDLE